MRRAGLRVAAVAFYAYFLWFTVDGFSSWFSYDDLMNLHNSLARIVLNNTRDDFFFRPLPAHELVLQSIGVVTDLDRPMGLAFYRLCYAGWGFTPFPFRVAALLLLSLNLWLLFDVARRVSGSRETAWLVMLITGLHASFASLYFDTGMIYDVLAFFFYFGALSLYLRLRDRQIRPAALQIAVVLGLFAAALNSKQIAISLPFAILLWELLEERPADWRWRSLAHWLWGPGRTGLLAAAVAALYAFRQMNGNELMYSHVGYRPDLSLAGYLTTSATYLSQWSYNGLQLGVAGIAWLFLVIFVITAVLRRAHLVWAAGMTVAAFLPLAFIPARGGYAFYLPAVFWAIWLAGVTVELRQRAASWAGAWTPHAVVVSQILLTTAAAAWLLPLHARIIRYPLAAIQTEQAKNHRYHDQLLELVPSIPKGARVLVLNDPYPAGSFDASFLIRLTYQDMTIAVDRVRFPWLAKRKFDPRNYDVALDFVDGGFVLASRSR